jgi:Zn-dependent peptidase ImmA (M78 family)
MSTLAEIFGASSQGSTAEDRALTSDQLFVRSQDHLSPFTPAATGRVLTAWEALNTFGLSVLERSLREGAAPLPFDASEPAESLRSRRKKLGLSTEALANATGFTEEEIASAEQHHSRTPIRRLERLAQALSLDERLLSFRKGAGGDERLAVRLKTLASVASNQRLTASSVVALNEAAWVIAAETRLRSWLFEEHFRPEWTHFEPSPNYGSRGYPAWQHGYYLARETRRHLGIEYDKPIQSLRELCERALDVPLVQLELPVTLAGATLANGDARGVAVNMLGANTSVWTRRLTIAHELGHLLWDPNERLDALAVDAYAELESDPRTQTNFVEQRANAFAIEFLAPQAAAVAVFRDFKHPDVGVRTVMEHFGVSFTAARYHLGNALDHPETLNELWGIDTASTQEWVARESFTADWFPIASVMPTRRGEFAGIVVAAEAGRFISEDTAAAYLGCPLAEYTQEKQSIADLFRHWSREEQP